ncbi:MAG: flagellar motor switch phosphatase FliY [Firmicutes bacterium]|nr:flagellar motor switch phosphatase FliY [Bacillota bacterium]
MDEFLSQEEIDALLGGNDDTAADEDAGQDEPDGELGEAEEPHLTEMEQDALAEAGNVSMGAAATALSTLLNHKVSITVPEVVMTSRKSVRERYPIPCVVINVEYTEGLAGNNLLVMKESDAGVIASLMLGEDGSSPPESLTELHVSAVSEAMNMMMGSSATAMSDMFGSRIDISPPRVEQLDLTEGSEQLPIAEPVVQVAFRIQVEDLLDSEMLQLIELDFAKDMVRRLMEAIGYSDSEDAAPPVEDELAEAPVETFSEDLVMGQEAAAVWEEPQPASESPAPEPFSWRDMAPEPEIGVSLGELGNLNIALIQNIPVRVRAILGRSRLPIETILRLGPGSIVELDTLDGEPIEILANDTLIAKGEVVVVGEQFGVRITEIATPQERISSVR